MRSAGFTLIELLIVISIISLLVVVGFVSFRSFAADQIIVKAAGQVQTYLRLAQSNATSYTLCDNPLSADKGSKNWQLYFSNATTIQLRCDTTTHINYSVKTYTIDSAEISLKGSDCSSVITLSGSTVLLKYTSGVGSLTVSTTDPTTSSCLAGSGAIEFIISKPTGSTNTVSPQRFTITKGGAINQ